MTADIRVLARAKVNLTLHVTGRRPDGYHLLDSLVVFPEIGDALTVRPGAEISLEVEGRFAGALAGEADNLVLRAARALAPHAGGQGARIVLKKDLPVASGIGGGSADAAAALHALGRAWGVDPAVADSLALSLGADVPVCLRGQSARMQGIGEVLTPVPGLPGFWLVLVNPGVPVPTRAVFAALAGFGAAQAMPGRLAGAAALADWAAAQRNDLETAAQAICPAVSAVLAALRGQDGVRLARMSGSGATCFGLCDRESAARAAAAAIAAAEPGWWVAAAAVPGAIA